MVVGELFPENDAIARLYPTAVVVTPLQRTVIVAAGPLIRLLDGTVNRVLRRLGVEPQEQLAFNAMAGYSRLASGARVGSWRPAAM